ncbi:MAG: carbohydrate kinase family protein [Chloroflexia bacterium]|nr:carbohydrate kinase family protein [Chloroflexia bacterium]
MGEWIPEMVVIGASCLDIKGRVTGKLHPATSNAGNVRIAVGGVARNVAENLARLGLRTTLLSVVARDPFGHQIVKHTGSAGVDVSQVLFSRTHPTAAYVALLDQAGQLDVAVDDTRIVQEITPRYVHDRRRLFRDARGVVLDANTPLRTAETVLRLAQRYGVPIFLDSVSYELAQRYRDQLSSFDLLSCGFVEAEALVGHSIDSSLQATAAAARQLVAAGVRVAIINLGSAGVVFASAENNGHAPAIQCEIVDPTGASDALTAAVIYGWVNGVPLDEAVWLGVSAAALTLQSEDTVHGDLSLDLLYQQLVG